MNEQRKNLLGVLAAFAVCGSVLVGAVAFVNAVTTGELIGDLHAALPIFKKQLDTADFRSPSLPADSFVKGDNGFMWGMSMRHAANHNGDACVKAIFNIIANDVTKNGNFIALIQMPILADQDVNVTVCHRQKGAHVESYRPG